MSGILENGLFALVLSLSIQVCAQSTVWKTEKFEDGKITVKSNVSEGMDSSRNTMPLIEYIATTTDQMSVENCIHIMKEVSRHKEFLDVKVNKKVWTFSENEWLYYYVFNAPWPFASSDCVVRVSYWEDLKEKTAAFTMMAAPNLMKPTSMKRFTSYHVTYSFKDMGEGKVETTVHAKMALTVSVPLWMLKASFPKSAAEPLQKLVLSIKKN